MRKLLITAISLLVVLGFGAVNATAGTITFNLNCIIDGAGTCGASANYGTLSISDGTPDDGRFDLTVDLVGDGLHKVQKVYLNWAPGVTGFSFDTDPAGDGVQAADNSFQADGFTLGLFDLLLPDPPPGSLGFEPYSTTIVVTGMPVEGLTEEAFNAVISGNGLLYVAVHIGNIGDVDDPAPPPGIEGEGSLWVGNTSGPVIISTTPEPGLLVLLGTGLLGVAVATRRRNER